VLPEPRLLVPGPDLGLTLGGDDAIQRGEDQIVPDGDPLSPLRHHPVDDPDEIQTLHQGP
jgi:hypothetical protein